MVNDIFKSMVISALLALITVLAILFAGGDEAAKSFIEKYIAYLFIILVPVVFILNVIFRKIQKGRSEHPTA
jgi:Kef-type K+ transport system membrane component KefB